MLRRLGVSLLIALAAAAVMGWVWRDDWPGPHPGAMEKHDEALKAWEDWQGAPLPPTAPPVSSAEELFEQIRSLAEAPAKLSAPPDLEPLEQAIPTAGLTVAEAIAALWGIEPGKRPQVGPLGENWPASRFDYEWGSSLDFRRLQRRWWSPSRVWYRLTGPREATTQQVAQILLVQRVQEETGLTPDMHGPGGFRLVRQMNGNNLSVSGTPYSASAVEDLYWRIRLEALTFDLAVIGLITGTLTYLLQRCVDRLSQNRRRRMGFCLGCGYDLQASRGNCPECGLAVTDGPGESSVTP